MKDKKSPKGPDLEIQYDDNQNYKAFLTGYIYTNAFQGPVKLSVDTNDFETVTFVRTNDDGEENENNIVTRQLEDDEDKKESTVLNKGFEVRGSIQPGRKNMQFRFTGDGVMDAVQTNYTILLTKQKEYFEKRMNDHKEWKKKVDEKLQEPVSKASKRDELEHMYNEIQGLKHEFRKQQYYKQQSCDQCNAVMSPGFIWDSCRVNDRLGKISCLQFKKDALETSNTQCLANCGIARSIGDENAKVLQHGINKKTAQLSKRSKETAIYDQLKSDVQEHQNAFNYAANLFKDAYMEFEKLDNDIKVQSISTDWLDFDDFEKATALEFTIKFDDDSVDKCNFIVDGGLYGNIAKFILNKYHENTITETDKKEKDVQTKYGVALQKIADWFVINRDFITKVKRGQVISPEARSRKRSGIPSPNKRVYDSMKVLASPSSLFYEDPMSTNMLLTNHAPWNALRRSNPFFARNGTVNQAKRHKTSKSASYCKNRRNKIRDYKDMVNYMKSWSDSFIDARNFIPKSKVKIATGLKSMEQQIMQKRSVEKSVSSKRHDISSKWINRLKAGFSNWEKEFSQQVASYYSYGPNMMLNEMNAIFTPAEFESLQAYIQSTPSNALSRSLMQDQSLYHIGQNFTTGLSSMRTLDDSRNLVNRMQYLISEAEKSSPRCHDEL